MIYNFLLREIDVSEKFGRLITRKNTLGEKEKTMNDVNTQPFGLTVDSRLTVRIPRLGLPSSVKGIEQSAGYAGPSGGSCIMRALFLILYQKTGL